MGNNLLFEEYSNLTDLYKFYLDIVLRSVIFVLGIVGAVLAYLLKESKSHLTAFGLFIPSALCMGVGILFIAGLQKAKELSSAVTDLGSKLNLTLTPHTEVLESALLWFGILLLVLGVVILSSIVPIYRYLKSSLVK